MRARIPPLRASRAFSVVELMVAMCLLLAAMALVLPALGHGVRLTRVQPDVAELDQRLRVLASALGTALGRAGAGTATGSTPGAITLRIPAVFPQRRSVSGGDPPTSAWPDRITVIATVASATSTRLLVPMSTPASPISFDGGLPCGVGDPLCGFRVGELGLVDDAHGRFDVFRISSADAGVLGHVPATLSRAYGGFDERLMPVRVTQFRFDAERGQIRLGDGDGAETPFLDGVSAFEIRYFGTALPPSLPRPPLGVATCLFDAHGISKLPVLAGEVAGLVPLPLDVFRDGPFCGGAAGIYDADLLRIRRVVVQVRLAPVSSSRWTGSSSALEPATRSREVILDVVPRNLDLGS